MKSRALVFVSLALALMGGVIPAARADDAAGTVVGSLALTNDYLFRGLSQTNQDAALQGSLEYDHASGWYAGAWGSNVSWLSDLSSSGAHISNSLELDFYTGLRGALTEALKYDLGIYTYYYPGDYPAGFTLPYTTELYVSLSYRLVTAKYSHSVTNLFGFPDSKNSGYLDLALNWEFVPTWTLNTHWGHQRVAGNGDFSYSDWMFGVTKGFKHGYSVALCYHDTDADESLYTNPHGNNLGRATALLTLAKSF
jgi:uncharacterized protein (TIGR02001 family)